MQGTKHFTGWRLQTTWLSTNCVLISRTSTAPVAMPSIRCSPSRQQASSTKWSRLDHTPEMQVFHTVSN